MMKINFISVLTVSLYIFLIPVANATVQLNSITDKLASGIVTNVTIEESETGECVTVLLERDSWNRTNVKFTGSSINLGKSLIPAIGKQIEVRLDDGRAVVAINHAKSSW